MRAQNSETHPVPAPKSRMGDSRIAGLRREAITEKSNNSRGVALPAVNGSVTVGLTLVVAVADFSIKAICVVCANEMVI